MGRSSTPRGLAGSSSLPREGPVLDGQDKREGISTGWHIQFARSPLCERNKVTRIAGFYRLWRIRPRINDIKLANEHYREGQEVWCALSTKETIIIIMLDNGEIQ